MNWISKFVIWKTYYFELWFLNIYELSKVNNIKIVK